MKPSDSGSHSDLSRRGFLQTVGVGAAGATLASNAAQAGAAASKANIPEGRKATVRVAFVYPPTETLRQAGYYSWPGSSFDAEGQQRRYMEAFRDLERRVGVRLVMDKTALDGDDSVTAFINEVKDARPDGLVLVPFKKGHWARVTRIVKETGAPSIVLATLGVLLSDQITELHDKPGVYFISSLDNFDALANGLRMIQTLRWMRDAVIINIAGSKTNETAVPVLGARLRAIPHQRFYDEYARTSPTDDVQELARAYWRNAKDVVEPTKADVLEAAKCYFALAKILREEKGDALMMDCLPGLSVPHKHVPPCMAFMSLRDQGVPAGCQSDLNATLTMMIVQQLFGRPGFQQNAAMETEANHYFGAHCTSPSKMNGPDEKPEPYILRSHCEAGWGCVPRVLFKEGQDVTMAQYISGEKPRMLVYTGQIVCCPPMPPAGGCRTNIQMTIREVDDVCNVKGMHQIIFYGDYDKPLRAFCRLGGIQAEA